MKPRLLYLYDRLLAAMKENQNENPSIDEQRIDIEIQSEEERENWLSKHAPKRLTP